MRILDATSLDKLIDMLRTADEQTKMQEKDLLSCIPDAEYAQAKQEFQESYDRCMSRITTLKETGKFNASFVVEKANDINILIVMVYDNAVYLNECGTTLLEKINDTLDEIYDDWEIPSNA